MRLEERLNDHEETSRIMLDGRQAQIQTNAPGIIVAYNAGTQTVTVQPAIKARVTGEDGTISYQQLPLLLDVPVCFPGGGGTTLTFPVAKGDECLVNFGSRDISSWWQSGGVQQPIEARMHDLSDAMCHVGIRSKARALENVSASTVQLRTDDGATHVEIDPATHKVNVVAPNGAFITGNLTVTQDIFIGPNTASILNHVHTEHDGPSTHKATGF